MLPTVKILVKDLEIIDYKFIGNTCDNLLNFDGSLKEGTFFVFPITSAYPNYITLVRKHHYHIFSAREKEFLKSLEDCHDVLEFYITPYFKDGSILKLSVDELLQWNKDVCNLLDNDT